MIPLEEVRPLVAGPVRDEDGATVISTPRRDVRIERAQPLLGRVLSACDGRRTVAQLLGDAPDERATAAELIEALLAHGALIDCTEAYRTFHWQSSVESGFFRTPSAETLRELATTTWGPRRVLERSHRLAPRRTGIGATARRRASATRASERRNLTFDELSAVLATMYGQPDDAHRPVPSGGGAYPLALHVVVRTPLDPLSPGLWWYEPASESLRLIRDHDYEVDRVILPEATADALVAAREPILFVSADIARPARKYANRAYRWALIEIGAALQNAYLVCAELTMPIRAIGGIRDRAAHEFLELQEDVQPILAVLLGS